MEHQANERLPPEDLSANDSPRKAIQSVEIGVRVLRALMDCPRDGAHLREVAEKSGLSRSQAHRYLLAFVNTGVVEQNVQNGRYALGEFSVRIGMAALARVEPVRIAGDNLASVLEELQTTGLLAVWGNYGPSVIRWIDGGLPLFTSLHVGSVLPLQASSTGILYLTHCSRTLTQPVIEQERASGLVVSDDELERQIVQARELGYATTQGTVVPGLSALSVPVFDSANRLVATMSVLSRVQDKHFYSKTKIEKILSAAIAASRAIGWQG
ncbi:IclR family transcriptional regulator [Sphingobium chungbukense]|uniref:IclR family transcriptional regulator n=1 Tax=Sphingobium chungbukense TaxID=56193 RepID=A0A0M3AI72_9SPHN|nr:IclR family transcriptional regulator [Sphingobium chungbukense]NML90989.1 IclR family transcriptional regulator [Sphingobium sp. TB-6]PNQ03410.1 IclR family transcriptional regulator [Sphingobium sp. SA916]